MVSSMSCCGTVTKAVKAAVVHLYTGMQKAPLILYIERLSTCEECEHFNTDKIRCNHCRCFIKVKANWLEQHCDLNKW